MAELWTKKKKLLTRKERFKVTQEISKAKFKEDTPNKLLTEEDPNPQSQQEDNCNYSNVQYKHEQRLCTLQYTCDRFRSFRDAMIKLEIYSRNTYTRSNHPEIDNLARIVPWINELVSTWHEQKSRRKLELRMEIDNCVRILKTLTIYIENPLDIRHVANWYECKRHMRNELYTKLDGISYSVLTNVEKEMTYLNMDVMYYKENHEIFALALWTVLQKSKNDKDEKFPLRCNFDDSAVIIHLTKAFLFKPIAVRCLVVLHDYFSTDCRTFHRVGLPEVWKMDFLEYSKQTWRKEEKIQKQLEEEVSLIRIEQEKRDSVLSKIKYLLPNSASTTANINNVYSYSSRSTDLKTLFSNLISHEEKQEIDDIKHHYEVEVSKFECNMRKCHIVGGIYNLDLVVQPPQPKILKDGAILRMIIGSDCLQKWNYIETYEPSVVKTEFSKQSTDEDDEDTENTPEGTKVSYLFR